MRIVDQKEPLIIKRATGTTNINAARFEKSMVIIDWQPFQYLEQEGHKEPQTHFSEQAMQEDKNRDGKTSRIKPKMVKF